MIPYVSPQVIRLQDNHNVAFLAELLLCEKCSAMKCYLSIYYSSSSAQVRDMLLLLMLHHVRNTSSGKAWSCYVMGWGLMFDSSDNEWAEVI